MILEKKPTHTLCESVSLDYVFIRKHTAAFYIVPQWDSEVCAVSAESESERKQMYQHSTADPVHRSLCCLLISKFLLVFYCNILYIPVDLFDTANCVLVCGLQRRYCCLKSNAVKIGGILYFVSIHALTSFCAAPLVEADYLTLEDITCVSDLINELHPVTVWRLLRKWLDVNRVSLWLH